MNSLWSTLRIKELLLNSRLVMAPMALDIAGPRGEVSEKMMLHYTMRAQGNGSKLGLVMIEHSCVSIDGKAHPRQLGIYENRLLPGLTDLVNQIHKNGIPVAIQLSHAGARGLDVVRGPSAIPVPFLKRYMKAESLNNVFTEQYTIPKPLEQDELVKLSEDFATAARRAKMAGFDAVEIHGAHGYLLNQFFSPLTNQRKDQYGGNLLARMKFPLEVVEAVRSAVGFDFPVFYRLGADDRMAGGNEIKEGIEAAVLLEKAGVNCLDLSGGIGGYMKSGPEGFFQYMAAAIKPATSVPILVTGGIKTLQAASKLVTEGHTDLVGVGRSFLADPSWIVSQLVEEEGIKEEP